MNLTWIYFPYSIQDGLPTLLKQVGSLIRLFKLHDAQNCYKMN